VSASDLNIKYSDFFVKPKGGQLGLNLEAHKENNKFNIKNARLVASAGTISLLGAVPLPPNFETDIQFEVLGWDLANMKNWFPKLVKNIPDGFVKGKLKLDGNLNISDPMRSVIKTKGEVAVKITSLELAGSGEEKSKLDKNGKLILPQAFLPTLDIIKNLNLNLDFLLESLKWRTFRLGQIQASGNISKSLFTGKASLQDVFSGRVVVNRIQIPLTQEDPFIQFDIVTQMVDAEAGITAFLPQWKGLVSGKTNIKLVGGSKLPGSPNFIEKLRSEGDFAFKEGVLSTLPITQMVQQRIDQYPAIKDKVSSMKPSNLNMKLTSRYLLENQRVQFNEFTLEDSKKNSIQLNGKMDFNLNLELKGNIAFFNSPVGGSFYEANKNSENRLMVPIHITGNAKSPELHTFDDTLKLMIANTIQYEKSKVYREISGAFDKQSDRLRNEAENQIKQKKKKIEDEVQKRLEGLIK
jgi:hypothetical protein